jgi:hypothetical protein
MLCCKASDVLESITYVLLRESLDACKCKEDNAML